MTEETLMERIGLFECNWCENQLVVKKEDIPPKLKIGGVLDSCMRCHQGTFKLKGIFINEEMPKGRIEAILLDLWTAHEDHTHSEAHNTPEVQAAYKGIIWYNEGQLLTCMKLLDESSAINALGIERYEKLREIWKTKKEELIEKLKKLGEIEIVEGMVLSLDGG